MAKPIYIWGQEVEVVGREWRTKIKRSFIQRGQHIKVGLNEKPVGMAAQENGVFVVDVLDKGIQFRMSAQKWLRESVVHNEPSVKNPGTTFIIYQVEVPLSAFSELVKKVKEAAINQDQLALL